MFVVTNIVKQEYMGKTVFIHGLSKAFSDEFMVPGFKWYWKQYDDYFVKYGHY